MGLYPNVPGISSPSGNESILVDASVDTAGIAIPLTGAMPAIQVAGSQPLEFRNMLYGGSFLTNPWQRGTSFTSISNTLTYTADRWAALGGASSSISVSRQNVSTTDGVPAATQRALRFGRAAANADTAVISLAQALESVNSQRARGRWVTLSFRARAGAAFSAVGSFLGVIVATGTGTDESCANLIAASWTGYAANQLYIPTANGPTTAQSSSGGNSVGVQELTTLTPANGVTLTTSFQHFQVTCQLPAAETQVGVRFFYTPVGTAGATDYVEFADIQLEVVNPSLPFRSNFERRDAALELLLCQRYFYRMNEGPGAAAVQANGMISATNVQTVFIPTPVTMRAVPTVTVAAGTWRFNIAGTLTAVGGGFAAGAAATQAVDGINVVGAVAATVGQATQLVAGAATFGGTISASAEL